MDADLATIFDGRQVISQKLKINQLRGYFINLYETKPKPPWTTPMEEVPCVALR
jgi:hypothetical protein